VRVLHAPKSPVFPAYSARVAKHLTATKYDCVVAHLNLMSGVVVQAAHRALVGQRVVVMHNTQCGTLESWDRRPVLRALRRAFIRKQCTMIQKHATAFISVGKAAGRHLQEHVVIGARPHPVIHLGVSIPDRILTPREKSVARTELGIPENAIVLGNASAFRPAKNLGFTLDCASLLSRRLGGTNPVYLLMVGDGPLRDEFVRKAASLGLSDRVRLPGNVRDVLRYYSAMDMLFFPSIYEGIPMTLVEAQAAGLPVVCSKIEANLEGLAPAWTSFAFELGDAEGAANSVQSVLGAPNLAHLRAQARDFVVREFSMESHCSHMARFLDGLFSGSSVAAAEAVAV